MRAWQFTRTGEPMELVELPDPTPGEGEVVVDVRACGLCHTDVGVLTDPGWMATLAFTPITGGHEVAGVVSAVGEGVTDWSVGDRVGICPTTKVGAPGFTTNGGFGEKVVIWEGALVAIPDGVSYVAGAAATDAGMTSYHAVFSRGGVQAGSKLGIIGLGGLGQFAARAAVLAGAEVYVADTNEEARELGRQMGATAVSTTITDFAEAGLDVVVDYAGFDVTTREAVATVRPGGRVVLVGMGKLEFTLSTMDMILGSREVVGSVGGTKEDVAAIYELFASGELNPAMMEIGFEEIPDGLERLHRGEVVGRLVATYPGD